MDEGGQYALKRPQSPLVPIEFQALTQQYPLLQIGITELNIFKMSVTKEDILYFMKLDEESWPRSGLCGKLTKWIPNCHTSPLPCFSQP